MLNKGVDGTRDVKDLKKRFEVLREELEVMKESKRVRIRYCGYVSGPWVRKVRVHV